MAFGTNTINWLKNQGYSDEQISQIYQASSANKAQKKQADELNAIENSKRKDLERNFANYGVSDQDQANLMSGRSSADEIASKYRKNIQNYEEKQIYKNQAEQLANSKQKQIASAIDTMGGGVGELAAGVAKGATFIPHTIAKFLANNTDNDLAKSFYEKSKSARKNLDKAQELYNARTGQDGSLLYKTGEIATEIAADPLTYWMPWMNAKKFAARGAGYALTGGAEGALHEYGSNEKASAEDIAKMGGFGALLGLGGGALIEGAIKGGGALYSKYKGAKEASGSTPNTAEATPNTAQPNTAEPTPNNQNFAKSLIDDLDTNGDISQTNSLPATNEQAKAMKASDDDGLMRGNGFVSDPKSAKVEQNIVANFELAPNVRDLAKLSTDEISADLSYLTNKHPEMFDKASDVFKLIKEIKDEPQFFYRNNRLDSALIAKRLQEQGKIGKIAVNKESAEVIHATKSRESDLARLERVANKNDERVRALSAVSSRKAEQGGGLPNQTIPQKPLKTADDEDIIDLIPDENGVYSLVFNGSSPELSKMGVEIAKGEIKSAGAKKLLALADNSANEAANKAQQIISANIAKVNENAIEFYANNTALLNQIAKKYPTLSKAEQIELANKQIMANAAPELIAYTKAINGGELPNDARMLGTNASRMVAKSLELGANPAMIRDTLLKAGIKGEYATALAKQLTSKDINAFNESIRASEQKLLNESVESVRVATKNESIGQILDSAKAQAIKNDEIAKNATLGYAPSDRLYGANKADIKQAQKEVRNLQKQHEQYRDGIFGENTELKAELTAKQERLRELKANEKANRPAQKTKQEQINELSRDELESAKVFLQDRIQNHNKAINDLLVGQMTAQKSHDIDMIRRDLAKDTAQLKRVENALKTSDEMPKNSIDELESGIKKINMEIRKRQDKWASELSEKYEKAKAELEELITQRNQLSGSQRAKLTKIINKKEKELEIAQSKEADEFYKGSKMSSLFETRKALEKELRELKNSENSSDFSPSGSWKAGYASIKGKSVTGNSRISSDLLDKSKPLRKAEKAELTDELADELVRNNAKVWTDNANDEVSSFLGIKKSKMSNPKMIVSGDAITHILEEHGKGGTKIDKSLSPEKQAKLEVTKQEILNHGEIVNSADVRVFSVDKDGQDVLVSGKQINGYYIIVETIGGKKNQLPLKTMYKSFGNVNEAEAIVAGRIPKSDNAPSAPHSPKPDANLDGLPYQQANSTPNEIKSQGLKEQTLNNETIKIGNKEYKKEVNHDEPTQAQKAIMRYSPKDLKAYDKAQLETLSYYLIENPLYIARSMDDRSNGIQAGILKYLKENEPKLYEVAVEQIKNPKNALEYAKEDGLVAVGKRPNGDIVSHDELIAEQKALSASKNDKNSRILSDKTPKISNKIVTDEIKEGRADFVVEHLNTYNEKVQKEILDYFKNTNEQLYKKALYQKEYGVIDGNLRSDIKRLYNIRTNVIFDQDISDNVVLSRLKDKTKLSKYRQGIEKELNITPIKEFGVNYAEFYHAGGDAVKKLLAEKQGQVAGAFYDERFGDVGIVWGAEGTAKSDGWGIAKIAKYHPEALEKMEEMLKMPIIAQSENRIKLSDGKYFMSIRKDFNGEKQNWVLTAFEKEESKSASGRRTDLSATQSASEKTTSQNTHTANSTPNEIKSQGKIKWGNKFKAKMAKMGQEYSDEKIANLANWHKNSHAVTKESDGSPKVFYHGTDTKFDFFDIDKSKGSWLGKSFYFTDSKSKAKGYGKNVMPLYLNIKNPYISKANDNYGFVNEVKEKFGIKENFGEFDPAQVLKENGYDGVVYKDWDSDVGTIYTAFSPNQIKSIDNSGAFNPRSKMIKGFSTQALNQAMLNLGSGVVGGNVAAANESDPDKKAQAFIMGFLAGFGGSAGAMKLISKNATKLAPQLARASGKMAQDFPNMMKNRPDILGGVLGHMNNAKDNFKNIFGGEKALGANKAKLEEAQTMLESGKNEGEIWAKTGWYKDIDNKWKFEINALGGKLLKAVKDLFNAKAFKEKNREKLEILQDKARINDKYQQELNKINALMAEKSNIIVKAEEGLKLNNVLDDKKLFSAYPELKDLTIKFKELDGELSVYGGFYDRRANEIVLNSKFFEKPEMLRSILYHEIQHKVQKIEGFARGGVAENVEQYHRLAGEVEARNSETRLIPSKLNAAKLERTTDLEDLEKIAKALPKSQANEQISKELIELKKQDMLLDKEYGKISPQRDKEIDKLTYELDDRFNALVGQIDKDELATALLKVYNKTKHPNATADVIPELRKVVLNDSGVSASVELEKRFLDKNGMLDFNALRAEASELPAKKSLNELKNELDSVAKSSDGKGNYTIQTPAGDIKIYAPYADGHTYKKGKYGNGKENRSYASGAIVPTLKEPLFITERDGALHFYKAFKDENGGLDIISVSRNTNGKLEYKTIYKNEKYFKNGKSTSDLMEMIKNDELVYLKGADAKMGASADDSLASGRTSANSQQIRNHFTSKNSTTSSAKSQELTNAKSVLDTKSKELLKQKAQAKNGDFSGADDAMARLALDHHRAKAEKIAKEKGVNSKEYKEAKAFADDYEATWFERDGSPKLCPSPCRR